MQNYVDLEFITIYNC